MWLSYLTMTLLLLVGILLIIVVLLQRGRGGGLAGALGGMGGQSAFGTKAGDVFTRITIVIAVIWVLLAGGSGFVLRADANRLAPLLGGAFAVEDEDLDEPPLQRSEEAGGGRETKSPASPELPKTETKSAAPAEPAAKKSTDAPTGQKNESAPADAAAPRK